MSGSSKHRPRKPEAIPLEELLGAAGMSGFGALVTAHPPVGIAPSWAETRIRFSLRVASLAEKLGGQNEALCSLQAPLAKRISCLETVIGILTGITRPYRSARAA